MNTGITVGVIYLNKNWSKAEAIIDKIYKKGKTVYFRAKIIDKTVNAVGGNKLFIDLEEILIISN